MHGNVYRQRSDETALCSSIAANPVPFAIWDQVVFSFFLIVVFIIFQVVVSQPFKALGNFIEAF